MLSTETEQRPAPTTPETRFMNRQPDKPDRQWTPSTQSELQRFVADNAVGERQALFPVGGRTSLGIGYPPTAEGLTICMSGLNKTVDYPSRDMTITVEPGLRVSELAEQLQAEGQQLPIDVPLPHRATLGGAVARNSSGPRRFGYGTLRDYLIGVTAIDGNGRMFHAGGRVVKNVAGYDLCKLLVGSLGTLGVVSQLTFKLKPVPESVGTLVAAYADYSSIDSVLERLQSSQTRPVALEVLNPSAARQIAIESRLSLPAEHPLLIVRVEGSPRDVEWQLGRLQQELAEPAPIETTVFSDDDSATLLEALTEYSVSSDDPLTFKANLLPSKALQFAEWATQSGIAVQVHAGNGIVIGHLPDEVTSAAQIERRLESLRTFARQHRGNLVILNCDNQWKRDLRLFGEPEAAWPLMERVKQALDPQNLLNPGIFLYGR